MPLLRVRTRRTLSTPSSACSQECHLWDAAAEAVHHPHHARRQPAPRVQPGVPRLSPDQRQHQRSRLQPASQRAGHRVHRLRRLPLVAAEARRQGRLHLVPHERAGVPPLPGQQPRLQELRRLPHHEARRQEGGDEQVRVLPQGQLGPPGAALQHRDQEVRVRRVPQPRSCTRARSATAVKNCRTCHRRQVPRRAAHAAASRPARSCHSVALRHDNGYQCTLCHRRAVHNRQAQRHQSDNAT